jgi:acyl-coenzyme A thioesterase PaaI-like protein
VSDAARSLQQLYAPTGTCFGCGPTNPHGLHIASHPGDDGWVVAEWTPMPHHQAFAGVLSGGIIGTLMDCHSNWTAAYHLMQRRGASKPPTTVTAEFHVRLQRPTHLDAPVRLRARVVESSDDRATTEATLQSADGLVTATCRGTFVAVKPGHPAYDRW